MIIGVRTLEQLDGNLKALYRSVPTSYRRFKGNMRGETYE